MNKPQVKNHQLTNVAVVRLKRAGKRFEIACYKNKVVNWRNGVETDIDEVLQIDSIFSSVSKGQLAKAADMQKAFLTNDREEICKFILAKGKLQVAAKERQVQLDSAYRDIATIVAEKTINPDTKNPYTISMIERAMKDTLHYAVKPQKSAKQQALEVIKNLSKKIPIVRASMRVRLTIPLAAKDHVVDNLQTNKLGRVVSVEEDGILGASHSSAAVICLIDPGAFREVDNLVRNNINGKGALEVMETVAVEDANLDHGPSPSVRNDVVEVEEAKQ